MRTGFAAALAGLALAAPAGAQPACTTGTLAEYIGLGATGCTVEGMRFAGFGVEHTPDALTGVLLTPNAGISVYGGQDARYGVGFTLTFSPAFARTAVGLGTAYSSLQGLTFTAYNLGSNPLRGAGIGMGAEATGGFPVMSSQVRTAWATLSGQSTAGWANVGRIMGDDNMGYQTLGTYVGPVTELPGSIDFRLDAAVQVGGGVSVPPDQLTTVEITSIRLSVITTAPEPGTWALLATGLLALGGVAARRKRPQA